MTMTQSTGPARRKPGKLRLADIATQAQVSEATVSRVLNDKPLVAGKTRQAVLTALDVLGYERPQHLRIAQAGLVGLVVPELTNPVFPAFAQVIETALARQRFTAVLCTQTPGGVHEDDYTQMLLARGAAGIIFVSGLHADVTASIERYQDLRRAGLPIVLVNGFVEGLQVPFISDDDEVAMSLVVEHLVDLGHSRIGLAVGPERFVPVIRKVDGFRASMTRCLGPRANLDLVDYSSFTMQGGAAAATRLMARKASAIICASDIMALGAISAARSRGLSIPGDVSIVGYDDSPMMEFTYPPLTTVRQNVLAMGEAAVMALMDVIGGHDDANGEMRFAPQLIIRGSTGPAA